MVLAHQVALVLDQCPQRQPVQRVDPPVFGLALGLSRCLSVSPMNRLAPSNRRPPVSITKGTKLGTSLYFSIFSRCPSSAKTPEALCVCSEWKCLGGAGQVMRISSTPCVPPCTTRTSRLRSSRPAHVRTYHTRSSTYSGTNAPWNVLSVLQPYSKFQQL